MWQTLDLLRTTVLRICTLLLCVVIILVADTAQAQEPETEYILYFPIIVKAPPWPYNVKAADLVLQPSDMPTGYELDEEESGPIELTEGELEWGKVEAYENWYSDIGRLFSGTPVVGNVVEVFWTPQHAGYYIQAIAQVVPDHPDFKRFRSVPTIGDETIAFEIENNEGLFPMTGFYIIFRKGNLLSWIATGGITGIVEFDDAIWFAQKSLNRINSRLNVAADGPSTEQAVFSGAREETCDLAHITGSLNCDNLTKAILQREIDIVGRVVGGWDAE